MIVPCGANPVVEATASVPSVVPLKSVELVSDGAVVTVVDGEPVGGAGNVAELWRYVPSALRVIGGRWNGFAAVYGVEMVIVPGFTFTSIFCVSEQIDPEREQCAGAATATTTAGEVDPL